MAESNALQHWITARISRTPDQVSTVLQGEVVILNVKSSKYYSLNPVGSRIWDLIEQPAALNSIVDAIMDEFNVERERCLHDVGNLLRSMHAAGLVQVIDEGAPSTDPVT